MAKVTVQCNVVQLGRELYIAMGDVAGLKIRGGSRKNAPEALASFYAVLGGMSGNTDDAAIACAFLIEGTNLNEAMGQLTDGEDKS